MLQRRKGEGKSVVFACGVRPWESAVALSMLHVTKEKRGRKVSGFRVRCSALGVSSRTVNAACYKGEKGKESQWFSRAVFGPGFILQRINVQNRV